MVLDPGGCEQFLRKGYERRIWQDWAHKSLAGNEFSKMQIKWRQKDWMRAVTLIEQIWNRSRVVGLLYDT